MKIGGYSVCLMYLWLTMKIQILHSKVAKSPLRLIPSFLPREKKKRSYEAELTRKTSCNNRFVRFQFSPILLSIYICWCSQTNPLRSHLVFFFFFSFWSRGLMSSCMFNTISCHISLSQNQFRCKPEIYFPLTLESKSCIATVKAIWWWSESCVTLLWLDKNARIRNLIVPTLIAYFSHKEPIFIENSNFDCLISWVREYRLRHTNSWILWFSKSRCCFGRVEWRCCCLMLWETLKFRHVFLILWSENIFQNKKIDAILDLNGWRCSRAALDTILHLL